jgi:hypothetical protein
MYMYAVKYADSDGGLVVAALAPEAVELLGVEAAAARVAGGAAHEILAGPFMAPAPSPAEQAAARRAQVLAELAALDAASARPLRAVLTAQTAGQPPAAEDVARLAELESQAQALRVELAELGEF